MVDLRETKVGDACRTATMLRLWQLQATDSVLILEFYHAAEVLTIPIVCL